MSRWRVPLWLLLPGVFLLWYTAHDWGEWETLTTWTRVHLLIIAGTAASMVLAAAGLLLARGNSRTFLMAGTAAAGLLGGSLVAGTLGGTIPCSGPG